MTSHSTEEEIFKSTKEELKRLAAKGQLAWKGKKVVLDPFSMLEFFYLIDASGENFIVRGRIRNGPREEDASSYEIFSIGALQNQIFRFWEEEIDEEWTGTKTLTLLELKELVDNPATPPLVWNCPVPRWKPEPLPILKLKDRTGAFADLWMDYGLFGQSEAGIGKEELFWEKDLLETDFTRKKMAGSNYYCPMDKVVKSLTFLLDIGWTIIDVQGKKIIRQGAAVWNTTAQENHILVKGRVAYGQHEADIKSVIGAFNRRERFLSLTENEVGLLEFPIEWAALAEEEIVTEGISVKRHHVGLLENITPIPPEYQPAEWKAVSTENFQGTLFDYQQQGLQWISYLYRSRFSGLLADEMGLGKTIQVMAFLSMLVSDCINPYPFDRVKASQLRDREMGCIKPIQPLSRSRNSESFDAGPMDRDLCNQTLEITRPVLIVMPVSLLFHWKREFEKFVPGLEIYLHRGQTRYQTVDELKKQKVILTSYSQLRIDRFLWESIDYEAIILDEAQAIKNPDSLTAQIACRLRSPFKLAMTGTPIENRYEDLWSLFRFLMPELLGERKESPVFERIRKKIRPFTLRRTKSEVALQLPEKQEQIVWVNFEEDQRLFYDQYLKEKRLALVQKVEAGGLSSQKMEILELILRLRQLCCHPRIVTGEYTGESAKFKTVCNDLEEVIASGSKVLLYSQFTSVLRLFKQWMEEKGYRYAYLDGQTKDREKAVESFQTDQEVQVFLMSLKAGGVGLNLQAADYVFLYDPWWNKAVQGQAIDRAHRMGRKNTVIARRYLMAESIEEKILKLQDQKQSLAENLLEFEEDLLPISLEDLYCLLV